MIDQLGEFGTALHARVLPRVLHGFVSPRSRLDQLGLIHIASRVTLWSFTIRVERTDRNHDPAMEGALPARSDRGRGDRGAAREKRRNLAARIRVVEAREPRVSKLHR